MKLGWSSVFVDPKDGLEFGGLGQVRDGCLWTAGSEERPELDAHAWSSLPGVRCQSVTRGGDC